MAKIVLSDVASGYNRQRINENFQALEDELNNKVLYRDNPAGQSNTMVNDLDMNSYNILNADTIGCVELLINGVPFGATIDSAVIDAVNAANLAETARDEAEAAAAAAAGSEANASDSADAAAISAGLAATSALESSGFADAADASASAAAISAAAADASAILATSEASSAVDSAAAALVSANSIIGDAAAAEASAIAAADSEVAAVAALDEFQGLYYGALSAPPVSPPAVWNTGDIYFDIPSNQMKVYDGSLWQDVALFADAEFLTVTGLGIGSGLLTLAPTDPYADLALYPGGGGGELLLYASSQERARITATGSFLLGKTAPSIFVAGCEMHASGYQILTRDGSQCQYLNRDTSDGEIVSIRRSGTPVGSIAVTSTTTSYNTSSDYRLKENDVPMTGATERVKALRPISFAWKATGSRVDGFFAHELAEVVPEAAMGTKDAMMDEEYEVTPAVVDAEGVEIEAAVMGTRSVPDYQGIDQSKLVPLLTATIQELIARIEILEAK